MFSVVYGNPLRLINGYDSFGNTCGVDNNERYQDLPLSGMNTANKPYVFFLDIKHLRQTLKLCVEECPNQQLTTKDALFDYFKTRNTVLCRYDFSMFRLQEATVPSVNYFDYLGPCPVLPVYASKPVLNRCVPSMKGVPTDLKEDVKNVYKLLNSWGSAEQFLGDIYTTRWFILAMCVVALVLSIVLIAFLHYLTTVISWLICLLVGTASIILVGVLWWTYYSIRHGHSLDSKYSYLEELIKNETAIYVMAICATIFMIFLLMVIFFMRKQFSGLAALFEEAGNCMLSLPGLFLPSFLAFIALCLFLVFWVWIVLGLATASYPGENSLLPFASITVHNDTAIAPVEKNNTGDDYRSLKLVEFLEAAWLKRMVIFYLIALIWTTEFIFACQQLTMAGAVAYWYFRKPFDSPVLQAMGKMVKYHLGSVAKGSFLITIFKIPRLLLTYLYVKLKRAEETGSSLATCCLKCCICWFWMLEKFVRYLNHNAYTVIAIESINFCPAAGVAWNALVSNALQVATINGVGDFVLFLGKLFVAVVCALVSILLLKSRDNVNFYVVPVLIIGLFSFFIAHVILSLYEVSGWDGWRRLRWFLRNNNNDWDSNCLSDCRGYVVLVHL